MKISKTILLTLLIWNLSNAQKQFSIKGNFPQAINKEIQIKGFTMNSDTLLVKGVTDNLGNFSIEYPSSYTGAALLEIKDTKSVIVLLNQERFEMKWDNFEEFTTLKFKNSPENDAFADGVAVAQNSESLLAGLNYLKPIYEKELQISKQKVQWISTEIALQKKAFPEFLKSLPESSYALYYLKLRKLLQDMPITASKYIERMPDHEKEFKATDFSSKYLIRSGLYKELLDGYFLLMESYGDLENVYVHINSSTDALLKSLEKQPQLKQDVAEYLFRLFEKRSLFKAAEHLALAMLDSQSCEMDSKHEALFEQYRKMAVGKPAVDIVFHNAIKPTLTLNAVSSKYKLVVFGASWCNKCHEEIPKLIPYYEDWKTKYDLEIIFISLDTELAKFRDFTKDFKWLSSCELKGWDSKAAIDYCVFGTPTMYLLNQKNTILLKPISEKQIQAWLDMVEK
jgi:thiol-disulfide isomerase/thioredoxin